MMRMRRGLMIAAASSKFAYEAYNLSFDRTKSEYIDTGIYLFNHANIGRDFEFIAEGITGDIGVTGGSNTIIGAKHNSLGYGFVVRCTDSNDSQYNGTISVKKMFRVRKSLCKELTAFYR